MKSQSTFSFARLLSLTIIILRFMHVVTYNQEFVSVYHRLVFHCMDIPHRHFGCLLFGTTQIKLLWMFFCESLYSQILLFLLDKYWRVDRVINSCDGYLFYFGRICKLFSKVVALFYFTFAPPVYQCSSSISLPTLGVRNLMLAILIGMYCG